jgi:hypothetical protein
MDGWMVGWMDEWMSGRACVVLNLSTYILNRRQVREVSSTLRRFIARQNSQEIVWTDGRSATTEATLIRQPLHTRVQHVLSTAVPGIQ